MFNKKINCCPLMKIFLENPKTLLQYYPIVREYAFTISNSPAVQLLSYCPWCGTKLPESLEDTYYEILEKEYGIFRGVDIKHDRRIPQEFKSNEWWKKRGL
jgi:hypothetical protein